MPRPSQIVAAELAFSRSMASIIATVQARIAATTVRLDPEAITEALRAALPGLVTLIAAGQVQAQQAAAGFVASYIAAASGLDDPEPRAPIDSRAAGTTTEGRPLRLVVGGSLATSIFGLLRTGRPAADALRFAGTALGTLAAGEIARAADDEIAHQATGRRAIAGWTWVTTGRESCAACLAQQDGEVRPMRQAMPRHSRCDCIRSIVLRGDDLEELPTGEQLFSRMSPARQAAQFRTAGEVKAELVRSGKLRLADLVAREAHEGWPDTLVERPLKDVIPA